MGSPDTIVLPAALFREMEIVPPTGASHELSSVPACVTMIDGTTVFPDAARQRRPGGRGGSERECGDHDGE